MAFETHTTSSGGRLVGSDTVTLDDGVAALELIQKRTEWDHAIIDVSASAYPFVLPRDEELDGLHLLVRTLRDLRRGKGFKLAIVHGPQSAARVADFVDLARSIAVDIEVEIFEGTADALAWVETSVTSR